MAHLVLQMIFGDNDVFASYGLWLFLSVGAVALFGIFLPLTVWMEHRRKEREAFTRLIPSGALPRPPAKAATLRSSSCANRNALQISRRAKV